MPIAHIYGGDAVSPSRQHRRHSPSPRPSRLATKHTTSQPVPQNAPQNAPETSDQSSTARFSGRISPTETRQELIDRVKRDQRAAWLKNANTNLHQAGDAAGPVSPQTAEGAQSSPEPQQHNASQPGNLEAAMAIERPRSALHRGDFREPDSREHMPDSPRPTRNPWLSQTSNDDPWFAQRQPAVRVPTLRAEHTIAALQSVPTDTLPIPVQQRARAASYTARPASFILRPPTSPLVNETQNSDSERDDLHRGRNASPNRSSRRRTFSPTYLKSIRQQFSSNEATPTTRPGPVRENSFPYQAHQPRRSTSSFNEQFSVPGTPSARSRRPSIASETSPLQRMPMVGRYEESILRGRMSSLPSRPLDFVAQIGVLGKGDCKPSLKCPPHVTVPFPAVFYNYGSRPGSPTSPVSDGPSPYVGMVDLDTNLKLDERSGRRSRPSKSQGSEDAMQIDSPPLKSRPRRTRVGEHALPKGGYRIPEQGQLQIVIKNPNKTAVKLFLVPYDLSGMVPGEKTFVRQRSYSAGPILDMPLSLRRNLGTDRPEAALSNSEDPKDRPVLRYLIHLNICCPSKGRHYLYKSIRVVFANRVPDGKEKLRQEIQVPEPRFSPWKPEKEGAPSMPPATLRHFSYGRLQDQPTPAFEAVGRPLVDFQPRNFTFPFHTSSASLPPTRQTLDQDGDSSMTNIHEADELSPRSRPASPHPTLMESPTFRPSSRQKFERLSRAEYAGPGARDRTQSPSPGHGLLAMQLQRREQDRDSPEVN